MKPLHLLRLFFFLCFLLVTGCKKEVPQELKFDSFLEELDYLVQKYVKMGAAVGIIDTQQELHEYYFGSLSKEILEPPDQHSVFEIGSISKTFTATILAQMILDGKIDLEDELESLLPNGEQTVPNFNGTRITIEHLVTHSSGLPKKPP